MGFASTLLAHKYLVLVGVLCTGFAIATIVLAVEVGRLNGVIDEMPEASSNTTAAPPTSTTTLGPQEPWEKDYRLPPDVYPLSYDLTLHPDLDTATFTGRVKIRMNMTGTNRDYVLVHQKFLTITSTKVERVVEGGVNTDVPVSHFNYLKNEFWVVKTTGSAMFTAGNEYDLTLEFNGILNGSIVGFYQSTYTENGEPRTIATSKFQPTYARQAFPCFDEPSFKSTFTVHLVRPTAEYHALSNMDITGQEPNTPSTGLTKVTFAESVPMVTYLACFIVSDFKSAEEVTITTPTSAGPNTFPFNVYATPGQSDGGKTKYALDTGVSVVKYYIEYFDIAYPLPKLDMVAIPDFVSGAMEHWGLITFREANLLYSDDVSSAVNKQRVAAVIAHELAHMWFGNLVTLDWWDDLWLNEGFASYMEFKGMAHAEPSWQIEEQFLIEDLHPVLKLDAVLSSHPIVQTVGHPDQITELFDTISYSKGASVIRMLEDFLGKEKFEEGIHNFLDKFKFANAITQDLWNSLQEVADDGINVTVTMDTWTRQMGFPVINVVTEGTSYKLTQKRFLADPNANTSMDMSPYGYKWQIPISYITSNKPSEVEEDHKKWMLMSGEPLTVPIPAGDWVKFNFHQIGYYRVNYETAHWEKLITILKNNPTSMNEPDRAHLLDDAFSLADAAELDYNIALDLSTYLDREFDYIPWSVASSILKALRSILTNSLGFKDLRRYVHHLVDTLYDGGNFWNVGSTNGHLHRRLRIRILDLACSMGHQQCIEDVGEIFNEWIAKPEDRPHPDIRSIVYYEGMASDSSEKNWDKMWDLFLAETDSQEKLKLMYGLAAVKEPWLLRRYLELAKNEDYVRSQDYFTVLTYISGNPIGTPIVWNFVRAEWKYLVDRFTLNDRFLGRLIPSITSSFTTTFQLEEMKTFFAQNPDAGAGAVARAQALETVANRIKWLDRNEDKVIAWLAAF